MESTTQNKKQKVERNWGLKFGVFIASIISFSTTMTGMYAISDIDINEPYHKTTIMLFLIVILIQASLVFGLRYFEFRNLFNRHFIKTIAALTLYAITSIFSITFSFTYWYERTSAQDHAIRSMSLQVNQIDKMLLNAIASLDLVAKSNKALSDYSTQQSIKEQYPGGTCDGNKFAKYGPFTQIRLDDAKMTKELFEEVTEVAVDLTKDISLIQKEVSKYDKDMDINIFESNINKKIQLINSRYFNSNRFESIINRLKSRAGNNRRRLQGVHREKNEAFTRSCPDVEFTRKSKLAIKRLNNLKPIETVSFFDAKDPRQLLNRTINVLWAAIGVIEIKEVEDMTNPNDITSEDMRALGIAVAIDLLILLLSIIDKTPKQQQRSISLARVKEILNGDMQDSIYLKLHPFMVERFSSYLIAIPNNISFDDDTIKAVNYIVQYIKLKNRATLYAHRVKGSKLEPYFQDNLRTKYADTSFTIYKMKKRQLRELLLEDLSGELS